MGTRRVAVLAEGDGWHVRQLSKSLAWHNMNAVRVDPNQMHIDLLAPDKIVLPGLDTLPDAVIVRGIPAGSFEQVTLRLGALHALARAGVPVINNAAAIERTVDKSACSELLCQRGLPTPPALATDQPDVANRWLQRQYQQGFDVVVKPLFGAEGKGIKRLSNGQELTDADDSGGVWYLQRYVQGQDASGGRDIRILVIGDHAEFAMQRYQAGHWVTNVAQGGQCLAYEADQALRDLAVRAAHAVGAQVAGVDLMIDTDNRPWILEVNSVPAWSGLQSVCSTQIADRIAGYIGQLLFTGPPADHS